MSNKEKIHSHCMGCGKPILIHIITQFGVMEYCWHCYDYYSKFISDIVSGDIDLDFD